MDDVVVVTGASAGIGQACASRLHRAGWTVFGASRRATSPGGWQSVVMDVDDDRSVDAGMATVIGAQHRLDAVVTCAGWGLAGAVEDTPLTAARDQFETNFWGTVRVVGTALGPMREAGRGRIVLMSSIGGVLGLPFQAFYSASKFALEGYAEALAYEVAPYGIEVTLVQPGNVATEFTERRRVAAGPDEGSDYGPAATRAIETMAKEEADGVGPERVAAVVQRVLEARRPPRRVSVGRLDERIGIAGKRVLPFRLFERAARGSLGV